MHPAVRQVVMGARRNGSQKLLMGFDSGVNGSQAFVDECIPPRKGVSFTSNANISTAQFKFGPSSLALDGADDSVRWPDSDDWYFPGPFTIDLWARPTTMTGVRTFINQALDTNVGAPSSSWIFWAFNGALYFSFYDVVTAGWIDITGGTAISNAAWTHVAVDRDPTGKIRIYKAGAMVASAAYAGELRQIAQTLNIGCCADGSADFSGHLDEIRILKGRAAWGTDAGFTPPTSAYPRR